MKYLLTMILIIVIIGCVANSGVNNKETSTRTESSTYKNAVNEMNEMEWLTYQNGRYGFSINYPADWTAGEESDNGDGKQLYVGNPDVDIRVYASQHFEGIESSISEAMRYQSLKLDSGIRADMLVGYEDEMVVLEVSWMSDDGIEYHYYAKVSKDFFEKNEKTLLRIAKSMKAF